VYNTYERGTTFIFIHAVHLSALVTGITRKKGHRRRFLLFRNTGKPAAVKRGFPLLSTLFLVVAMLMTQCLPCSALSEDDPLDHMRDQTLAYFQPMVGTITGLENDEITIDLGEAKGVKRGMRFSIFKEEAPFRHPVTKEVLGNVEAYVGKLQVTKVGTDSSVGQILEGNPQTGNRVRISEIAVNALFCQSQDISWYLADRYYRKLKQTGRFNLVDTSVETDAPSVAVEEAKRLNAEVALLLAAEISDSGIRLVEKLIWVSDSQQIAELDTMIDVGYIQEVRKEKQYFSPVQEAALLQIPLQVNAKLVAPGDIDGDGTEELLMSTGREVRFQVSGPERFPVMGDISIQGSSHEEHLWLDSIDLNGNGRAEVLITSQRGNTFTSFIYELDESEFRLLYEQEGLFMRVIDNALIAQKYAPATGFDSKVFSIIYHGGYKKGEPLNLPAGVNIYDFIYFGGPGTERLLLAYDEAGYLNVFNSAHTRIWRRETSTGGFLRSFKKSSPTAMVERGEWSVKDRLFKGSKGITFIQRVPLVKMVPGLGFRESQIRTLWWNGLSMEEGVLIDNMKGTLLDYTIAGGRIIALRSPLFGFKAGNILKGENPVQTELLLYSLKGN
jgi:hypothetical protein